MKRNMLFALLLAATSYIGCKKEDASVTPPVIPETGKGIAPGGCIPPADTDCNGVICTAHFGEVVVEVQTAAGSPAPVDSFVVTNLSGVPLPPLAAGAPVFGYPRSGNGEFTVINDSWLHAGHQNSRMQVLAKGYIRGVKVFDEPYTIVADCCHVGKFSGKDVIIIP